jgi:hypothetical protein
MHLCQLWAHTKQACSKPIVIAEEAEKWVKEWDEDVARKLAYFCEAAMDDYAYLLQFSI